MVGIMLLRARVGQVGAMPISLALDERTLYEKLAAMELLWDDLARNPGGAESPDWHESIASERRELADGGMSKFTDWDAAKAEIRGNLK